MSEVNTYHYKKSRKQRAIIFINMAVFCLIYIAGLYGYEYYYQEPVSENTRSIFIISFALASAILFYAAYWHFINPANYEAYVNKERFVIDYPGSSHWS